MKFLNLLTFWLVLVTDARPNDPATATETTRSNTPTLPKPILPPASSVNLVDVGSMIAGAVRGSLTGIFTGRKPAVASATTSNPSASLTSAAPRVQDAVSPVTLAVEEKEEASTTSNGSCSLSPDSPCPLPKASAVHAFAEGDGAETSTRTSGTEEASEATTPTGDSEDTSVPQTTESTTWMTIESSTTEGVSQVTSEETSETTTTGETPPTWSIPISTTEYAETTVMEVTEASTTEDPNGGPQMTTSEPISPSDDPTNPCRYEDHLTALTYTCCRKKKYHMPKTYLNNFEACFEQPRQSELSVGDTLWELHECLLNYPNEKSKWGLEELAEFMTQHFDGAVKREILSKASEVAKGGFPQGDIGYDMTKKVVLSDYYHIERGVCENNYSPPPSELKACQIYTQNYHARSDCCRRSPIPIRLDLFRTEYLDEKAEENSTARTCVKIPEEGKFHYEFDESVIQQMCSTYCGLVSLKIVDRVKTIAAGDLMGNFDVKGNTDKLLKAFSTIRSNKIKAFMNVTEDPANYTILIQERLKDYGFAKFADFEVDEDVDENIHPQMPFMTDVAMNWLVHCESWNELVRKVEAALLDQCDPGKEVD